MANVVLKDVVKRFGDVTVVHDANLEIHEGEFLVLVGPSGCGKSTTLRMIAGLEEITEGEIYIGDRLVNDVAPKDRDIAMVFQNYALYPHMNVYENMAFGLKLRKFNKKEIDKRVEEAAQILGIKEYLRRKPKELSGGQRQRVALGRAIVRDPQVFLMDEPLSNLDAKLRVQMRTELAKLHQRLKTTTIYVTHDQTEAMTMGQRIVVMKDGWIQQVASPQEIYDKPANLFVASFVGSPQMNFVTVNVSASGDATTLTTEGLQVTLTGEKAKKLQPYNGKQVTLGIRPEDISNRADKVAAHPEATVDITVEVVEHMGSESYLYTTCGGAELTVRVEGGFGVQSGENQKVVLNLEKAHAFDLETEAAIF